MSSKKHKPGVRTDLNSGDKKVQLKDSKSKSSKPSEPNPTAVAASKKLPEMKLVKEANWAAETTSFVLSAMAPAAESVSLPAGQPHSTNTEVVFVDSNPPAEVNIEETVIAKNTDVNKTKNKYKKKKKKDGKNIISNVKDYIAQGIEENKIDYEQLKHIQEELQGSMSNLKANMKESINSKMSDMKIAANALAESAKQQTEKIKKQQAENAKKKAELEKKAYEEMQRKDAELKQQEQSQEPVKEEKILKELPPVQEAERPKPEDRTLSQKLNQAIQRRDGAEKALSALNAQLKYAKKSQQASIKERIERKTEQLEEAKQQIEQLLIEKDNAENS